MDTIYIKGLEIFAYHGVNPEEKRDGQHFYIDADLYCDLTEACASDNLDKTVNYAKAVKAIRAAMTEQSYDLIERAAEVVCQRLLDNFDKILKVELTLKKPEAPISAVFDYVAVCITRER